MDELHVAGGIATIRSTILIPTECALVATSSVIPKEERTCLANFTVALHLDFPDQEVVIWGSLSNKGRTELCSVLKKNLDIFAWQPSDMTGVPRPVAEHRLNIREGYSPVRLKKMGQAPERAKAIQVEVQKLKETAVKDKPTVIYMVQSWQRTVKQKVTQSFEWVGEIAYLQLAASNGTEGPLVIEVKEIMFPPVTATNGTEGPLIIEAEIGGHIIHRMYIDGGSSMEILYEHCFNRLRPEIKSQTVPANTSLTGFSGETTWPLVQLRLLVTIGDATHSTKAWMNFMVVKSGVVTICSSLLIPVEYASISTSSVTPMEERTRPANFTVALHPNFPDQEVVVGGSLSDRGRTELCSVLKKNLDIFAWQPSDMTGVPRSVAEHRLNIREGCPPVRQKKMGQALERAKAIQAKVQKLVEARIMREVYYHDWLSNPVMVRKHDGSWWICVDFTNLNKACLQDCYPLPEIDWKVESLCGYPFKCFLDAYKGYHQIQLAEADEEKTAFHTGQGVYCYTKMPFGLKNAGATYQRLMDKAFKGQVGRNIEVYVDDLVVKSHTEAEMVRDIEETFRTLRKVNMKLNPKKCSFGLAEGVFLGYVVTPEGIKPCPDKTAAVRQLPSPRTIKEVQSLNEKLASLNRVLSRSAEKSLPLFQTLKKCIKKSDFHWTAEAKQAFQQCGPDDRARNGPNANLLYKLRVTGSGTKLLANGETGFVTGLRSKKTPKVFSGTSYHGEHNITYRPRTSVKGQILADFLIEMPGDTSQAVPAAATQEEPWTLFIDGSSCVDGQPFYKWGIDIAGPFPKGPGKVKFLIVAMDYFTKWIVTKAVATITDGQVKKFVWDNIVCRFGEGNKNWVEELPHVLWAHRTMIKLSHGDTLFSLTYGTEAVIPAEIGMPTYRTAVVDVVNNDEELRLNLDLLEERRERAAVYEAKAKLKMMKYYNARAA
nr:reverse transcriptase domain-containing protein [Tanacetum cinerariifolium]